jgi:photosystem II stability/assembly factor-like uncharacterized protein
MTRNARLLVGLFAIVCAQPGAADDVKVDSDTFGGLEARSIGPAAMSGRIAALDAVPGDRLTIYAGAASGGVWKSVDGGLQFKPVFDKAGAQSIGAIKVDPQNPKTLWVGTGETWVRNSVSVGDGVYKSTDGGDSWTRTGLEASERIARIAIDPKASDTVFVCVTGHLYDDSKERGVYRTKDGGKTWENVLFVAEDTGCGDLAMDPQDARVLYAGMWQVRRKPYFFTSGGPKSGLYKSTDGGTTWRRITKGLPDGDLGRIALAVSPVRPAVVYATVEAKQSGFYRSDDLGETWALENTSSAVSSRPFYFSLLVADPKNLERVYKTGYSLSVSDDAGKTWSGLGGNYHGDTHAVWLHPANPDQMLMGTDGGLYQSLDRGAHWRFIATLPVSQFYHVSYDMEFPYNVYGGLQDNNTWYGPSRKPGGIGNKHWNALTGGDGFWAFPDPTDADLVYSEYQGGNLFKTRKSTGEAKDIKPTPRESEPKYRFNWNTPIHVSEAQPGTLYFGAQFLFRSRDRGENWERISPDLTTSDPQKLKQAESGGLSRDNSTAENHCTIFTISESPKNTSVVWAGTDDGNVQLTRDAGKTWTNVTANLAGLPKATWVSHIEASGFEEGTAYASFDGHMTGDMKTYVYRTADFGKSWQSLATADLKGYAHVVKQDRVNQDLLFVGTESGLFASVDGGKQWGQFMAGLPSVAVRDLVIHPRENDLVIATHGRGVYILDDLTPLRSLTPQLLASDVSFLPSRPAMLLIPSFGGADWSGDDQYEGRSVGEVAYLTYYLKKRHIIGDLKLEVYDASGKLLSSMPGGKRRGLNRVEWPMRQPAPKFPAGAGVIYSVGSLFGPRAPEGSYTVKLIKGKETFTSEVKLVPDPRVSYPAEDKKLQQETTWKLYAQVEKLTYLVDSITSVRDQARARAEKLPARDALRKQLDSLSESMEAQRKSLVATQEGEGISGEEKLREELGMLYGNVNFHDGRPTGSQLNRMAVLGKELDAARGKFEAAAKGLEAVNSQLKARKLDPVTTLTEVEWRGKSAS